MPRPRSAVDQMAEDYTTQPTVNIADRFLSGLNVSDSQPGISPGITPGNTSVIDTILGGGGPKDPRGNLPWSTGMQQDFWEQPELGLGNVLSGAGFSTSPFNSAYNRLLDLVGGLKWMQTFTGTAPGQDLGTGWQNTLTDWIGDGRNIGTSGWQNAYNTLIGGGNIENGTGLFIDTLTPQNIGQAINDMLTTAGFGNIAPEMISGIGGALASLLNAYNISGQGSNLANNALNMDADPLNDITDADMFRQYLSTTSPQLLDLISRYFGGLPGALDSLF